MMPPDNGETKIIKIGMHGRRKFQFGDDDSFIVEVDVVAATNAWTDIDRNFRGDDGKIPADTIKAVNHALWDFVKGLIMNSASGDERQQQKAADICDRMSLTTALEFMARLTEESQQMRSFFEVKSSQKPSSQESTKLRFST